MTASTTIAAFSSLNRAAAQPDHPGLQADFQRAAAQADRTAPARSARLPRGWVVLAFAIAWYGALLGAALMPAQASAAQAASHAVQASVKETAQTNRVPGRCTQVGCR
jgi:hypothetical protein